MTTFWCSHPHYDCSASLCLSTFIYCLFVFVLWHWCVYTVDNVCTLCIMYVHIGLVVSDSKSFNWNCVGNCVNCFDIRYQKVYDRLEAHFVKSYIFVIWLNFWEWFFIISKFSTFFLYWWKLEHIWVLWSKFMWQN